MVYKMPFFLFFMDNKVTNVSCHFFKDLLDLEDETKSDEEEEEEEVSTKKFLIKKQN